MTVTMTTITGRPLDLQEPDAAEIDLFGDVPEHLARLCRFTGAVPGGVYSVAQHCVAGADAILAEAGDAHLAACFLLHDAHEAYIGDIATPVVDVLAAISGEGAAERPRHGYTVRGLVAESKRRLDVAIYRAAGLPRPDLKQALVVHGWDVRMMATEIRHLRGGIDPALWPPSVCNAHPVRMRGKLTCWPVARAADEWRARLATLCPNARRIV